MNRKKMLIRLLDQTKEEGKLYILTIALSVTFIFNLMNIFHIDGSGYSNTFEKVSAGYLILITIIFVLGLTFYSNNYLLQVKSKEIGIEMLGGLEPASLAKGLTYQTFILNSKGVLIGSLLGAGFVPLFNFFGNANSIFEISIEGILYTLAILLLQTIMVLIVNYGFGYTKDINELIEREESLSYLKQNKNLKGFKNWMYIYFVLLISPLLIFFIGDDLKEIKDGLIIVFTFVSSISLFMIIEKFIPLYIDKEINNNLNRKIKLIVLKNIKFRLYNTKFIFYGLTFIVMNFIYSFKTLDNNKIVIYNLIVLAISLFLISFTLIYRILSDTLAQAKHLSKLYFLGYLKSEILFIVKSDIKALMIIGAGLNIISIISFLTPLLSRDKYGIYVLIEFLFIYIGILTICYFLASSISLRIIKRNLKGD
ncbi:hypothetical protein [Clostridium chrysemydis]|uniref:hypothetical protein n=1 Tax=Clostridium chrysemydis TaxID=2665504 RepID=UPI0018842B2F|nr:hypothetical protein [Clostridium chrysemydis]